MANERQPAAPQGTSNRGYQPGPRPSAPAPSPSQPSPGAGYQAPGGGNPAPPTTGSGVKPSK